MTDQSDAVSADDYPRRVGDLHKGERLEDSNKAKNKYASRADPYTSHSYIQLQKSVLTEGICSVQ
eukprot:8293703-Pyramimonas_sp.AAC.1